MAQKYSSCLVNLLTGGRNLRSILDNCVLKFYTGAAPSDADQAETGTLLCTVSVNSAMYGNTGATGEPTPDNWFFTFPPDVGPTAGYGMEFTLSIDGATSHVSYAIVAADSTKKALAAKLVNKINQAQRPITAIYGTGPSYFVGVRPTVRGVTMSIYDGGATADAITAVQMDAATRPGSLQFGPPTAGLISKLSGDTWTGVNVATGVAGYFRLLTPNDNGAAIDSTFIYPRVQGSVGTSGSDLNLDSVQFVVGAVTTISNFAIQEPTSA